MTNGPYCERACDLSTATRAGLLVFADDWGRHPSSCQHLVRHLLSRRAVCWVNTIGIRPPRFDLATLRRGFGKLRQWLTASSDGPPLPNNLRVLNPRMWPRFTRAAERWLNRKLLVRQLTPVVRALPAPPIAVTTLPIVADLMDDLPVRRWVYYCVDDFGQWPGLDQATLRAMEKGVVRRADALLAASETLQERLADMGRASQLLTHGVDLDFWQGPAAAPAGLDDLECPLVLFWGVIDRRTDVAFVERLAAEMPRGTIVLLGPQADPDPRLFASDRIACIPALPFEQLPDVAQAADVLMMPYADQPVTRAMQPLKLKEYLATGRPVVARRLPSTRGWGDCLDLADTPEEFAGLVPQRIETGLPQRQRTARAPGGRKLGREGTPIGRMGAELMPPAVIDVRVVTGAGGGPDKTILNQPRFLAPAGYRNLCAFMHPPDDPGFEQLRHKAQAWQAPLISIPDCGPWDASVIAALLQVCRRERVRIWHGHDYKSNLLGLLLRRFWPMRLVTTVHGWVRHTRRTPVYYWLDRLCLPRYEKVICVSSDLQRECLAAGVPNERCVLIENAIDLDEFSRRRSVEEAKVQQGIDPARRVVGAVGRLSAEKGLDLLIRAVDRLLAAGVNLELLIAGEGDEQPHLQELIEQLGRDGRIRLLGYRADLRGLYEAMDVFALSSLREGLPNVVLEAMALEVPIVATSIAGVPGVIADGVNGLLVSPGSVDELAAALGRLLADADLRRQFRRAGRRTVEQRYNFAARMERIRGVYDELLGRGAESRFAHDAIASER